jgi:hypothetical protein
MATPAARPAVRVENQAKARAHTAHALLVTAVMPETAAPSRASDPIPNFAPSPRVPWITYGPEFIAVPNLPKPVASDPECPWRPNAAEYCFGRDRATGNQTTYAVADLTNPNLEPATRTVLAKLTADVLAGEPLDDRPATCWPLGLPNSLVRSVTRTYFIETPHEVLIIAQGEQFARHIRLNQAHVTRSRPPWYADSVGHHEGDTLVVDMIAVGTRTFLDYFCTPRSAKLHVIES